MITTNDFYRIEESTVHQTAEDRFILSCGIDIGDPKKSKKYQRMMEMGLKTRESGIDGIDIRIVTSFFGPEVMEDGHIRIGEADIFCNYFTRIPKAHLLGMYFYMMTVGECLFESEDKIMEFLYADIWGNSYCDAGIEAFKSGIVVPDMKKRFGEGKAFLSDEYGPGYFGMHVLKTREFAKFLDCEAVGIRVKDTGMMIPQKSCAGLFLVTDSVLAAEPACMHCLGNSKGCEFCEIRMRNEGQKG